MSILEVVNLTVEFKIGKRYVPAVSNLSLSIGEGQTLGIVGESGCGKSVTAGSIMRLLPRATSRVPEGSIRLCGRELLAMTDKDLNSERGKTVSMVFQEPMTSLNPVHTIGAQLREMYYAHSDARQPRAEANKICVSMLEQVGIPAPEQKMKEYPHQLSGGMRQRVMIAMALLCDPALLIADEPTTALDVTVQAQILELIKKMQWEKGTSVLLITHDMGIIANNTDYVAVMYAGQIIEYGDVNTIFTSPQHPYTYGLLRAIPRVDSDNELYSIEGQVPSIDSMPEGCRFRNRCDFAHPQCETSPDMYGASGSKVRCHLYCDQLSQEAVSKLNDFYRAKTKWTGEFS